MDINYTKRRMNFNANLMQLLLGRYDYYYSTRYGVIAILIAKMAKVVKKYVIATIVNLI